jgi:hypothetical protein
MAEQENVTLKTPVFRVSFPNIFEKNEMSGKFQLDCLFDADADLSALKKAAGACVKAKWGDKVPKNLRSPFRDAGEKEQYEGYEKGMTLITMRSTKRRPGVVGPDGITHITEEEDFYGGCYARATCTCYAYGGPGTKIAPGVAIGVNNIQKVRDGESFSGATKPEDDFEPAEGYEGAAKGHTEADTDDFFKGGSILDDDIVF